MSVADPGSPPLFRPDVIVSSGPGRLHFPEVASAIAGAGWNVLFLTGWIPGEGAGLALRAAEFVLGERNLRRRLAARVLSVPNARTAGLGIAEGVATLLGRAARLRLLSADWAGVLGFSLFGRSGRRFIRHGRVFHVRSGAGRGGALSAAKKRGMVTVTDHSIAHPRALSDLLASEYAKWKVPNPFNPDGRFWGSVLADCEEADVVLVNSDFVRQTFLQYGFPPDRLAVVYLGVRTDFFGLKTSYATRRPYRLLFTGHVSLRKGVGTLLEAARGLRRRGMDLRLTMLGHMGDAETCLLSEDSDFLDVLPFVPQDDVKRHLRDSDLFVFPTLAEGSSRSAMEALAAGLPVITTFECGVPVSHGQNGWYVPAGDARALEQAIEHLLADEPLRESLGRHAAQMVRAEYTWSIYGQRVVRLYQSLLDRNPGTHPNRLPLGT
jgi:glycosyltransferase involved in cell wall biosynthesis